MEQAADGIRKATGGQILAQVADVSRMADIEALVAATVAQFGGLDILVNNAGQSAAGGFETVSDEAWQADIDLKLMGRARRAIRICSRRGGGIINITNRRRRRRRRSAHERDAGGGINSRSRSPTNTPTRSSSTRSAPAS